MTTHRFNHVPINLDTLKPEEVLGLAGHIEERLQRAIGELAVLEAYFAPQDLLQTELQYGEA